MQKIESLDLEIICKLLVVTCMFLMAMTVDSYAGLFLMCAQGTGENLANTFGCCHGANDESHNERCESILDGAVHFLCHSCALCQESRELRRRLPHPGFSHPAYLPLAPPMEQHMGLPTV